LQDPQYRRVKQSMESYFDGLRLREARNLRKFYRMLEWAKMPIPLALQALLAQRAATFAAYRHTGLYWSRDLELWIEKLATRVANQPAKFSKGDGSTLHVLSRAYSTGGHTKVVERWINDSSLEQKHSVVLTRSRFLPEEVIAAVNKHQGDIHALNRLEPLLTRAKKLRLIASSYSRIVIHVHMDDILPTLAFSEAQDFGQIVHFNHADHRFWVGARLPTRVIEMRAWGKSLSLAKRGLSLSEVVGIPMPESVRREVLLLERERARDELELPREAQILLTIGHARKYASGPKTDFPEVVRQLLARNSNTILLCVGLPKASTNSWKKLQKDFPGQVKFIEKVSREDLEKYIFASDVGIDSFPMSGGTAVLDMFTRGVPVFSLKCETGHFDTTLASKFYCPTVVELINKVEQSLNSSPVTHVRAIQEYIDSCNIAFGPEIWGRILDDSLTSQNQNSTNAVALTDSEIADLDGYLVASTPRVAKLFF
jgi:hypothetical protein